MKRPPHTPTPVTDAAYWCTALKSGQMSEDELVRYKAWIDADPQNTRDLVEYEAIWEAAAELRGDPEIEAYLAPPLPKAASMSKAAPHAAGGWWTRFRQDRNWQGLAGLVAAAVILIAVLGPASVLREPTIATAVGEQRVVTLEDGSVVRLNTDTRIMVEYTPSLRLVKLLSGEATFEVAHNKARPFEVEAGTGRVRAVGTIFNVRATGPEVTIAVLEGAVRIRPDDLKAIAVDAAPKITAGEQISYSSSGITSEIEVADTHRIESWQAGRLDFDDVSLATVVTEMNRYAKRKLVIGDERLTRIRISGSFKLGDIDSLVAGLAGGFGVQAVDHNGRIVLLSKGEPLPPLPSKIL